MAIGVYRFKVNVSVVAFFNREINGVQAGCVGGSMKLGRIDGLTNSRRFYLFANKFFLTYRHYDMKLYLDKLNNYIASKRFRDSVKNTSTVHGT